MDVAGVFSVQIPLGRLTYFQWVGLVQNVERSRRRRSIDLGLGFQAVLSDDQLDRQWADAAADDPAEADRLHEDATLARLKARAQRKMGW